MEPQRTLEVSTPLRVLIESLSHRLVVVGSVARLKPNPRDIDLLYDMDSARAESEIREAIKRSGLTFDSAIVGNWCFGYSDYGEFTPLEILPIHHGPTYRTVRKRATECSVAGMWLKVARPEDALA